MMRFVAACLAVSCIAAVAAGAAPSVALAFRGAVGFSGVHWSLLANREPTVLHATLRADLAGLLDVAAGDVVILDIVATPMTVVFGVVDSPHQTSYRVTTAFVQGVGRSVWYTHTRHLYRSVSGLDDPKLLRAEVQYGTATQGEPPHDMAAAVQVSGAAAASCAAACLLACVALILM